MDFDIPISTFASAESGSCRLEKDKLVVVEGRGHGAHIIRARDKRLQGNRIRVTVAYRPTETCQTNLLLEHRGWILVCCLSPTGAVLNKGHSQEIEVVQGYDGSVVASVTYWSADDHLGIGVTRGVDLRSTGQASDQYFVLSVKVEIIPAEMVSEEKRVVFVDVGARGGFSQSMQLRGARVLPILFEPDGDEARNLRETCRSYPGAQIHERALFNETGARTLYLTRNPGCSSLLPPNIDFVKPYPTGPWFEVVKEIQVECVRYDQLFIEGKVPAPDAIKIDVQGTEYHVLEGFGNLLQNCLGIELECHTYPLYEGERCVSDITTFLARFGLMLHRLQRVHHFLNEWVEFDAWFIRPDRLHPGMSQLEIEKLGLIKQAWNL